MKLLCVQVAKDLLGDGIDVSVESAVCKVYQALMSAWKVEREPGMKCLCRRQVPGSSAYGFDCVYQDFRCPTIHMHWAEREYIQSNEVLKDGL